MLSALLAGAVAGLAVAVPIGAIGSYQLGLAARERHGTAAAAAALGVATVDGAYALLAPLGRAGLQVVLSRVAEPIRVLAALVLLTVAVRTLLVAVRRSGPAPGSPVRSGCSGWPWRCWWAERHSP